MHFRSKMGNTQCSLTRLPVEALQYTTQLNTMGVSVIDYYDRHTVRIRCPAGFICQNNKFYDRSSILRITVTHNTENNTYVFTCNLEGLEAELAKREFVHGFINHQFKKHWSEHTRAMVYFFERGRVDESAYHSFIGFCSEDDVETNIRQLERAIEQCNYVHVGYITYKIVSDFGSLDPTMAFNLFGGDDINNDSVSTVNSPSAQWYLYL